MSEGGKIPGLHLATPTLTRSTSRHVLRSREGVSEGHLQTSGRGAVANRMGVFFIAPIWTRDLARCYKFPTGSGCGARAALLHSGNAGERSCHSGSLSLISNGLSWSRPRGQTDSPTSTICTHLAPRSRREGERQRLWDIVAAQVHHPEPVIRADRRHRTGAELRSAPGLRSGPRMQGRLGPRVRTDRDHVRGRIDDRENFCPRLGLSSERWGDERRHPLPQRRRHRSGHRVRGYPMTSSRTGSPPRRPSVWTASSRTLESFRARYRTADLYPHIVIDDFLVPAATERGCQGVLRTPLPAVEQFLLRQRAEALQHGTGDDLGPHAPAGSGRVPIRRGSSAS